MHLLPVNTGPGPGAVFHDQLLNCLERSDLTTRYQRDLGHPVWNKSRSLINGDGRDRQGSESVCALPAASQSTVTINGFNFKREGLCIGALKKSISAFSWRFNRN